MVREVRPDSNGQAPAHASRPKVQSLQGSRSHLLSQAGFADQFDSLRRFSRTHRGALIGGVLLIGGALAARLARARLARARSARSAQRDGNRRSRGHTGSQQGQWRHPVAPEQGATLKELTAERSTLASPPLLRATAGVRHPAPHHPGTSGTSASASSATDVAMSSANYGGGSEPGAISTGSS